MSRPDVAVSQTLDRIAAAMRDGAFNPQHAGEVFLRSDAQKAIRQALGTQARILVAGRDEGQIRSLAFLGAHFTPDLVVDASAGQQVAVTITLLRGDAAPVTTALAAALVLAGRYAGVVAFILDRRLAKRNPFDDPIDQPEQRDLSPAEQSLIGQLAERHHVHVVIRRQDPFGW